ncbi:MAG: hypothetical protein FJ044_04320 [Candidatus Cloacimonetes bacterium]|nr:hypothetical protein [Candidatus Cloacimonadota bacterium]
MAKKSARQKTFTKFKKKLKSHQRTAGRVFVEAPKKAQKFLTETEVPIKEIVKPVAEIGQKSVRLAAASALTGALLLTPDGKEKKIVSPPPVPIRRELASEKVKSESISRILAAQLQQMLPPTVRPLTKKEEQEIERALQASLGIKAAAELDGHRLNTNFGLIGQEQHLLRYPGDTISEHDEFQQAGMAPKTPAWSYLVKNKESLDAEAIKKEKYYVAVQTFLSPGWSNNSFLLKDWFKFRKVLVVNPKDGSAVVAVIGDAGPASWTGKQYGGSPEVIHALNLPAKRGEVLLFFLDDPEGKIPLGPYVGDSQVL